MRYFWAFVLCTWLLTSVIDILHFYISDKEAPKFGLLSVAGFIITLLVIAVGIIWLSVVYW